MTTEKKPTKSQRVTMADVARLAGVSLTTVSFVVNNLDGGFTEQTKRKVLRACKKLNYTPNEAARRLATKHSRAIGLAIYDVSAIPDPTQSGGTVLASVYRAAESRGHRLHVFTTHNRSEDGLDVATYYTVPIRSREVDGVVLSDEFVDENRVVSVFRDGLPIVTLDRRCGDVPAVVPDYEYGCRAVAEFLAERGYEPFSIVARPGIHYRDSNIGQILRHTASELGIAVDNRHHFEADPETQVETAHFQALVNNFVACRPWPRAVVCMYDALALALVHSLRQMGVRVPEDIAVIGCSGVPASSDRAYQLTTLDLRYRTMAQHAVDLLLRMLAGENIRGTCVAVQPELIIRSSA